jgi:hypothetical protein
MPSIRTSPTSRRDCKSRRSCLQGQIIEEVARALLRLRARFRNGLSELLFRCEARVTQFPEFREKAADGF